MDRSERFYCHLGFLGVISEGYTSLEPEVAPSAFVGYGHTPDAAYTAARRALVQRFRDREEVARELTKQRALESKGGKHFPDSTRGTRMKGIKVWSREKEEVAG